MKFVSLAIAMLIRLIEEQDYVAFYYCFSSFFGCLGVLWQSGETQLQIGAICKVIPLRLA